ncbi:MAG: 3-keto-5-aminohexanoate cleavage protein [Nanoarchaeota archaeon]|nr:3-keto-5-aminohexanoate cleavage protein [Nanoarchaeota archaeon]
MGKIIITCALTGGVPTKEMTPYVPVTPEEIAESAYSCYNAGAAVVHVHARDENGMPTSEPKVFEDIVTRIRGKCPELIINISTGGRGRTQEERGSALYLKPEMASLTTGSVNFPNIAYVNPPDIIEMLARQMKQYKIKPELEIFDSSMIPNAVYLHKQGLIDAPLYFNFVLGLKGAMPADGKYFFRCLTDIPEGSIWTVSGIGKSQLEMNLYAIFNGGHVRTGIEDNIWFDRENNDKATNERLVERVVRLARKYKREPATPDEARQILGLIQ